MAADPNDLFQKYGIKSDQHDPNDLFQLHGIDPRPKSIAEQALTDVGQFGGGIMDILKAAPGIPVSAITAVGDFINKRVGGPGAPLENQPEWWQSLSAPAFLERANHAQEELGLGADVAPTNEQERIARKTGSFFLGGGPAAIPASMASVVTSEGGRLLDQGGLTGGYGEFLGGLLGGPTIAGARTAADAVIPNLTPTEARQATYMMNAGVPVAPGQAAHSNLVKSAYGLSNRLNPVDTGFTERQAGAINHLATDQAGLVQPDISVQSLAAIRNHVGNQFDRVLGNNALVIDQPLLDRIRQAADNLAPGADPADIARMNGIVGHLNIQSAAATQRRIGGRFAAGRTLPGPAYQRMVQNGGIISNMRNAQSPTVRQFGNQVRDELDQQWLANAAPRDAADFLEARRNWANLKTLEKQAKVSGDDNVNPVTLMRNAAPPGKGAPFDSVMRRIGQAGKTILKTPSTSNTAENAAILNAGLGAIGSVGAGIAGAPVALAGIGTALGGMTLAHGAKRLLESQRLMRAMVAKSARRATAAGQPRVPMTQSLAAIGRQSLPGVAPSLGLLGRQNLGLAGYITP